MIRIDDEQGESWRSSSILSFWEIQYWEEMHGSRQASSVHLFSSERGPDAGAVCVRLPAKSINSVPVRKVNKLGFRTQTPGPEIQKVRPERPIRPGGAPICPAASGPAHPARRSPYMPGRRPNHCRRPGITRPTRCPPVGPGLPLLILRVVCDDVVHELLVLRTEGGGFAVSQDDFSFQAFLNG